MLNKLKKSNRGFTIIEVMIVLAIAGLILLIVFLAVPALQRNARNTQRKNDAASVASAIANYIANNQGNVPTKVSDNGSNSVQVSAAAGATAPFELAKLGFFTTSGTQGIAAAAASDGNVYMFAAPSPAAAPTPVPTTTTPTVTGDNTNALVIIYGQDCTPTANPRTAAVYYVTESGNGNGNMQCTEQ